MRALRLEPPGGLDNLRLEELPIPDPAGDEVLVRVHAAAITRDELDWPADRLPATPSYELSGVVVEVGEEVSAPRAGEAVYGLTPFDRDGVAAEYAAVPALALAPRPRSLRDAEAAALPLAGLSAWQGLFVHGRLKRGERVLIHGASGGVGHLATQLAHWAGAYVIGSMGAGGGDAVRAFGADQVVDRTGSAFEDLIERVDLVFDTVGGDVLARSVPVVGPSGRVVSVAEKPPDGVVGTYFVVEPNREQLIRLTALVDEGALRPAVDSTFPLTDALGAFQRVMSRGKSGKVVLAVRP
jgi:NADPH:quinone reductase-like Zn-dependent oxidoreductase